MIAMARDRRMGLIAAIIGGLLILDVFMLSLWHDFEVDSLGELVSFGLALGFVISQLNLVSVWAAMAPGRIIMRLPWSFVLLTLLWYSLTIGNRLFSDGISDESSGLLAMVLLSGYFATQIPLWIATRVSGWRLVPPTSAAAKMSDAQQFSLRELVVGMTVLAGIISLGRLIFPDSIGVGRVGKELLTIVAALMVCNLLLVVPCVWGAFKVPRSYSVVGIVAAWWIGLTVLVSVVEVGFLFAVLGAPGKEAGSIYVLYVMLNLGQCLTVFAVLGLLRWAGYRMVRRCAPGEPAP